MRSSARMARVSDAQFEEMLREDAPFKRVRVAKTAQERMEAGLLVTGQYIQEGYLPRQERGRPFYGLHHLLNESVVFVMHDQGQLVGTITVFLDSIAGLPMDRLWPKETRGLRQAGRRLCEFGSLALVSGPGAPSSIMVLDLFRVAYVYAYHFAQATDVCVTLKPKHRYFYRRLCFESFGSCLPDPGFGNVDAIAMRLPFERTRALMEKPVRRAPRYHLHTYCSKAPSPETAQRLRAELKMGRRTRGELMACLARRPELLMESSPTQRDYLAETLRASRPFRKPQYIEC